MRFISSQASLQHLVVGYVSHTKMSRTMNYPQREPPALEKFALGSHQAYSPRQNPLVFLEISVRNDFHPSTLVTYCKGDHCLKQSVEWFSGLAYEP